MTKEQWHKRLRDSCAIRGLGEDLYRGLVHYVDKLFDQGLPVIFDLVHLSRLTGIQTSKLSSMVYRTEEFYTHFRLRKLSGTWREIDAPTIVLKDCQKWILRNILDKVPAADQAHGFVGDRSILTNSAIHACKEVILNVDIKDFFPSIKWPRVFHLFRQFGYSKKVSFYLARLTTLNEALPQGAPTSPSISNHVSKHLDRRLSGFAKILQCEYSRYADDITFSGDMDLPSALPLLRRILKEEGFEVNESKIRVMRRHRRQEVTGLVVNQRPNIRREHLRWLRQQVYYLRKYGVQSHMERMPARRKNLREFLYGHALFVKMVNPPKGRKLLKELDSIAW